MCNCCWFDERDDSAVAEQRDCGYARDADSNGHAVERGGAGDQHRQLLQLVDGDEEYDGDGRVWVGDAGGFQLRERVKSVRCERCEWRFGDWHG